MESDPRVTPEEKGLNVNKLPGTSLQMKMVVRILGRGGKATKM